MTLRVNQIKAIEKSVENNFSSGVHHHATGTGKSWIAFEIVSRYNDKFPYNNVLWVCEQKSILIQQFKTVNEFNKELFKRYTIINYTEKKPSDWFNISNKGFFTKKPILLIINRSFLVSKKNMKN